MKSYIYILVISRMAHLICYEILGAHTFFLPGTHSMLKPALYIIYDQVIYLGYLLYLKNILI